MLSEKFKLRDLVVSPSCVSGICATCIGRPAGWHELNIETSEVDETADVPFRDSYGGLDYKVPGLGINIISSRYCKSTPNLTYRRKLLKHWRKRRGDNTYVGAQRQAALCVMLSPWNWHRRKFDIPAISSTRTTSAAPVFRACPRERNPYPFITSWWTREIHHVTPGPSVYC